MEHLSDQDWSTLRIQIPPELSGYGPELLRFFDAMIYKLRRNAHKGKWEDVPITRAFGLLEDEVGELEAAIKVGSTSEVLMEAADVANLALIAANIAMEARDEKSRTSFRKWHASRRAEGWIVGRVIDAPQPLEILKEDGGIKYFLTEGMARARAAAMNGREYGERVAIEGHTASGANGSAAP